MTADLTFHPVTPDRWSDLETLFGERGAYAGCWCMWWRMPRAGFDKQTRSERREALKSIVDSERVPGLLAYRTSDGRPVGWCSVGPRSDYGPLKRSRVLKSVDGRPVWSVVCFYVDREARGTGMMGKLLEAAAEYAASRGAEVLEGYPVDTADAGNPALSIFMGVPSVFLKAGFEEVERRSPKRPIMRRYLNG